METSLPPIPEEDIQALISEEDCFKVIRSFFQQHGLVSQ